MSTLPPCPQCGSAYTYEDGALLVCPECGHEWSPGQAHAEEPARVVRDAVGNVLQDGDTVTIRGWSEKPGHRVGFGEVSGAILPALPSPFLP